MADVSDDPDQLAAMHDIGELLPIDLVRSSALPVVLASGSRYRASMLARAGLGPEHGFDVVIDPPDVDERALDHLFDELGAAAFATVLARAKADVVAPRQSGSLVLAGDQVGVVDLAGGAVQMTKQPDEDTATAQLLTMSGTTHRLVNSLVVVRTDTGDSVEGIDEQTVTMRTFTEDEARSYLRRFEPYDSSGCYRLEDQPLMAPIEPFITEVVGEHPSGVLGLPLPLLGRMLADLLA